MTQANTLYLLILLILCMPAQSFYSRYSRKCRINKPGVDVGNIEIQKSPDYYTSYHIPQRINTTIPLQYRDLDFIYDSYVAAGGSGQVYTVEQQNTKKYLIVKRFFKENMKQFELENFIMKQMNYSLQWSHQDNDPKKPTLAIYESKNSVPLSQTVLDPQQDTDLSGSMLYKICKQVLKSQQKGILHNDLKLGNILVNSVGSQLKQTQIQLIDWNLAYFYSQGFQSIYKHGTKCYYSPQKMFRSHYITPASDIFSLAVVLFTFLQQAKPYPLNCKDSDQLALLSMVGSRNLLNYFEKYKTYSPSDVNFIQQIKQDPDLYGGISLWDRVTTKAQIMFNNQLIDLFEKMLDADPQYRLTIQQVLIHPYFDRVKKLPPMKQKKLQAKMKNQPKGASPNNNLSKLPQFDKFMEQ